MQGKRPELSPETLKRFAEYSGLEFTTERLERITPRVQRFLEEYSTLEEVDVSNAEPPVIFTLKPEKKQ